MQITSSSTKVFDLYQDYLVKNTITCNADLSIANQILEIVEVSTIKELQTDVQKRTELNTLYKSLTKSTKDGIQEIDPRKVVFKDINLNGKNFLDYGSNKFDTVMKLDNWGYAANYYACDLVDKTIDDALVGKIDYKKIIKDSILPYQDNFFDLINVQYVLHHIDSDESINNLLKEFRRILKDDGQIIVWEESFDNESRDYLPELQQQIQSLNLAMDLDLSKKLYELSDEEKLEFILLNDVMINLNNAHMQWDVNYKSKPEWMKVFSAENFSLNRFYNFGLRNSGSLKQGSNFVFYFEKSK